MLKQHWFHAIDTLVSCLLLMVRKKEILVFDFRAYNIRNGNVTLYCWRKNSTIKVKFRIKYNFEQYNNNNNRTIFKSSQRETTDQCLLLGKLQHSLDNKSYLTYFFCTGISWHEQLVLTTMCMWPCISQWRTVTKSRAEMRPPAASADILYITSVLSSTLNNVCKKWFTW